MTTQLAIKTDEAIKKAAQQKASAQGVTLTFIINTFLKKFAKGDFEIKMVSTQGADVSMDELFQNKKIIKQVNKISEYLSNKEL